jgi:hypothetical protein
VYHGSEMPGAEASIQITPLRDLAGCVITAASTLFVPPVAPAALDVDTVEALGMAPHESRRGRWAVAGLGTSAGSEET